MRISFNKISFPVMNLVKENSLKNKELLAIISVIAAGVFFACLAIYYFRSQICFKAKPHQSNGSNGLNNKKKETKIGECQKAPKFISNSQKTEQKKADKKESNSVKEEVIDDKNDSKLSKAHTIKKQESTKSQDDLASSQDDLASVYKESETIEEDFLVDTDFTDSDGTKYEGKFNQDRSRGEGTITYHYCGESSRYEGTFENKLLHGYGKRTSFFGNIYEGNFECGVLKGEATLTYTNGVQVLGNFIDGKIEGKATILYPNNESVEDIFKKGAPSNVKLLAYPREELTNKQDDTLHTSPTSDAPKTSKQIKEDPLLDTDFTDSDGIKYEGKFNQDRSRGEGTITYPDRSTYTGTFDKDGLQGEGTKINGLKEGIEMHLYRFIYTGFFIDNQLNGKGKKNFLNVENQNECQRIIQEGRFKNDLLEEGESTVVDESHGRRTTLRCHGTFEQGSLKSGTKTLVNPFTHSVEEGNFVLSNSGLSLHGHGKRGKVGIFEQGQLPDDIQIYEGNFESGNLQDGPVIVTLYNGIKIAGNFIKGKLEGEVTITLLDKSKKQATFKEGKQQQ